LIYSTEYHHRHARISKLRTILTICVGVFSLGSLLSTYAFGVVSLVLIAVAVIFIWCGREILSSQDRRYAHQRELLDQFDGHEAAFLKASPEQSEHPVMIVCSWDELKPSKNLVRLVLMKRDDDDFVLVAIAVDGDGGYAKIVVESAPLNIETAVNHFAASQADKVRQKEEQRRRSTGVGGGGEGSYAGDGCSDGGCGGGDGGGGGGGGE